MAIVTSVGGSAVTPANLDGVLFDLLNYKNGALTEASVTGFTFDKHVEGPNVSFVSTEQITFAGSGFSYGADGFPIAGTITTLDFYYYYFPATHPFPGQTLETHFAVSGLSFDLSLLTGDIYYRSVLIFAGNDQFTGGAGDDRLTGYGGNDVLNGVGGVDTVDYYYVDGRVIVDLGGQVASGADSGVDTLLSIENIRAGNGDDALYGSDSANVVYGGLGADVFVLRGGNDTAYGGQGNDYVYAGDGNDTVYGEYGVNVLRGEAGDDVLYGYYDQDYIFGGDGADLIEAGDRGIVYQSDINVLSGGAGNDVIHGGANTDYLYGDAGIDTLYGGYGVDIFVATGLTEGDIIYGEEGNDYVYAGDGGDTIYAGGGVDVVLAAAGSDVIDAGKGTDYLFLGPGGAGDNDTVIVDKAASGIIVMNNFEAGGANDTVRLTGTGWTTFAQVQTAITDYTASGGFCILTLDSDTAVWFIGVQPGQLTSADFVFA